MLIDELKNIARNNGIVGAGGAGFPAYAKMTEKADTVILNCVESVSYTHLDVYKRQHLHGEPGCDRDRDQD